MGAKCEREGRAEITLEKMRWLLDMAYPVIGSRPIAEIDVAGGAGRPAQDGGDGPL